MLLQSDRWVGEAITNARIAYECLCGLLRGEIKIEPESSSNLLGGTYVNLFTEYAKGQFLSAVSVLHRGFLILEKGRPPTKTEAACRMENVVSVEKIDEFLRLAKPFQDFPNYDQHREQDPKKLKTPKHPPVWAVQMDQAHLLIVTQKRGFSDPFPTYDLLKSLEPAIGLGAFVTAGIEAWNRTHNKS
jgi:hypothetical protein